LFTFVGFGVDGTAARRHERMNSGWPPVLTAALTAS